jgi:hypothetical protein
MTHAVCFRCGEMKWGAFNHCEECRAMPNADDELMMSLAFTDHYFELERLQQIGSEIKSGRTPRLPDAWKEQLAPAVREAKVMLGINRVPKKEAHLTPGRPTNKGGRKPHTTKRLGSIFVIVLLFVVPAIIAGVLLDLTPSNIRRYLGYVIIPAGGLWLFWSWFKRYTKQRGDQNELDVLEETVREHERGRHDNTEYIKQQIFLYRARPPAHARGSEALRTSATRY